MHDVPSGWWSGWLKGRLVPGVLAFIALVVTLAACGGGDSTSDSSDNAAEEPSAGTAESAEADGAESGGSAGSESSPVDGMDVPDGLPLAEGLIPELALLPLPDGAAVFQAGSAYTAEQDPRETAVQMVHFTFSPEELTEFYLAQLPAAGYAIVTDQGGITDASEIASGRQLIVIFTDPDGLPGHVTIAPGGWSPSQMNINLFRSGIS